MEILPDTLISHIFWYVGIPLTAVQKTIKDCIKCGCYMGDFTIWSFYYKMIPIRKGNTLLLRDWEVIYDEEYNSYLTKIRKQVIELN